ncbi:unnamed protein product [Didymodactylos carnosus]|uniref:Uncharacterized protein n=1 Tax=Didymodactylos carnosus TaxID=1234261 RepID=A0A815ZWI7_9BILA|nr:unnamed protein product [Didymodactylos carnosus]CAF4461490.1 unnamed protein product [Didymodactylos carnosus]
MTQPLVPNSFRSEWAFSSPHAPSPHPPPTIRRATNSLSSVAPNSSQFPTRPSQLAQSQWSYLSQEAIVPHQP